MALVDTLYVLCARYKKQLRHLILTASNGRIGVSTELAEQVKKIAL